MNILLTAFEPFGGKNKNSSAEALKALRDFEGVKKIILPVVFGDCFEKVYEEMKNEHYDYVLMFGASCGRPSISIEKVAINLRDSSEPDNKGNVFSEEKIFPGGPDAYFTNLNAEAVKQAFKSERIPLSISYSAGTYVCNDLFYGVMHKIKKEMFSTRAGFFHIPCLTEQVLDKPSTPSISVETALKGMETILILAMEGAL